MKKLNVAILEDNDDLRFDLHSEIEDKKETEKVHRFLKYKVNWDSVEKLL